MAGYEFKEVYDGNDPYPYAVYANADNFRVVKLGAIPEIIQIPTNGRVYEGTTNGFIVTTFRNASYIYEVYATNIFTGSTTMISNINYDKLQVVDDGIVVYQDTTYKSKKEDGYNYAFFRARIISYTTKNNILKLECNSNFNLGEYGWISNNSYPSLITIIQE